MGGDWFGFGSWKPLLAPQPVHKLKQSRIDPEVVDGGDDRRPHFRKAPAGDTGGSSAPGTGNAPPEDPDRPTLRKRPAGNPDNGATSSPETAAASANLETATAGVDADRPKISRGVPKDQIKEPEHLEGTPANLEQMIAISDSADRSPHPFTYSWSSTADAAKMQAALVAVAQQAIVKANTPSSKPSTPATSNPATASKPAAARRAATAGSTQRSNTVHSSATRRSPTARHVVHKAASVPTGPLLTDVEMHAFELTYSGGSTLVLSARTTGDENQAKYVTVIAQPDIYGTPEVLLTYVTSGDDLDARPRLKLVDAVDAAADNRGDLLFELRGATTRQFAIYRVASGHVDQMIATGPLPIGNAAGK